MNRRYQRKVKTSKLKDLILTHVENNIKEYVIITIIFLIGIIIGVIFINNVSEEQSAEINSYISSSIKNLKDNNNVNELALLKDSIKKNCVLAIFLWFMGSTVIGISIVYLTICFRGFCLGYTISSIILSLGTRKRNFIFTFYSSIAAYFIYTLHNNSCCEWNEVAQFYNEG